VHVVVDGYPHRFSVPTRAEAWAPDGRRSGSTDDAISAPFPGTVTSVGVAVGDTVAAGTTCVVIEAMKMLHSLTAPTDAVVAAVEVSVGDQVASHQVLVTFASPDAGDDSDTATAS